jgi:DNA-binding transcriptional MocR family regulator
MRPARLQSALDRLTAAIRDVEAELAAMEAEHDPLASHIFISRRRYRNANYTKSGKPRRAQVLAKKGAALLRYASHRGDADLRKAIAAYLCDFRGAHCHPDQIVIVAGMQQAIPATNRPDRFCTRQRRDCLRF